MRTLWTVVLFTSLVAAQDRSGLFFREDFKETPPETPATQKHIANPGLVLELHGPGKLGIKKSHHEKPVDDPYYIWSGTANGNWAVSLRHQGAYVDLTGQAKIRWRTKQAGFRMLRIVLRLANGTWLVSDQYDPPSSDWRVREFNLSDIRWRKLNIETVVEDAWIEKPDLSQVDAVGWTDLMTGGGTPACSRVDWIEVYGQARKRR